jgi:hypothetical protein
MKLLVENILRHPTEFDWSVQGLGMMRVYLAPQVRLHVWDRALLVPGASPLHTHPWDFASTVVAGRMVNARFTEGAGEEWNKVTIKCGENACTVGEAEVVRLLAGPYEIYGETAKYQQKSTEIHWSQPEDGTVTIVERVVKGDPDHASVYWRGRGGWVDAKPRPATPDEVLAVTDRALKTWF